MIILSITGRGLSDALGQIHASARYADIVEFRLDLIGTDDLERLLRGTRKPRIVTCRPRWEGGAFDGSEEERVRLLESAAALGAEYIDVELDAGRRVVGRFRCRRPGARLIVSRHHFGQKIPDPLREYRALAAAGGDVVKMAYTAEDVVDNRAAFEFLSHACREKKRAVAIAMGEAGEPSRILYRKFGGWATYASSDTGSPSAPGQIPASLLARLYRARDLTRRTKVFGVLGNPVGHSRGVFVHNPLLQSLGRDGVYCRFPASDLRRFFAEFMPYVAGCSVTLPFKEEVGKFLDSTDDVARAVGAVNTIFRRGKRLCGTNTDAPAALDAVERVMRVAGKRVCVIGAGGAARAIVFEARRRGGIVTVANRTTGRALRLAEEFGVRGMEIGRVRIPDFDIFMNATPVGMVPNEDQTPLTITGAAGKVVFDAVYNPPVTRFLREAGKAGARFVPGTEMYVRQGARQFELFNHVMPDLRRMRRLLAAASREPWR